MSSNSTSTTGPNTGPSTTSPNPPTNTSTTAITDPTSTDPPPPPPTSTPPPEPPPPTSTAPPPPPPPPPTSSSTSSSSSSLPSSPTATPPTSTPPTTTTVVTTDGGGATITTIFTVTQPTNGGQTGDANLPPTTTTTGPSTINPTSNSDGGLSNSGKIAIAVVVPIAAVALLILAGIFFWRKRKQRKDAEEQRRKEVEEYGYNPNADPTIPVVGGAGQYEMKEDGSSGYRGWGSTTMAGSTGRKASTTMSGGGGVAFTDASSPTRGGVSDTRSGEPLMSDRGSPTPDGEILGAMGPSASQNRSVGVHRGPSNASSSYSNARSDGSGDAPVGMGYGDNNQYDQYGGGNPYADGAIGGRQGTAELSGQPVIRDVTARRNTRIENPAHYPQNAGISQNF